MKSEKFEYLIAMLNNKTEYVILIKILKQALNHILVQEKNHRVIKFIQQAIKNNEG